MGFLTNIFAGSGERQAGERRSFDAAFLGAIRGGAVSPGTAEQMAMVFACVRVLAESVAMLPLVLYERTGDGRQRAISHPLYTLLHDLPNPEMTSVELRMAMMRHLALYGNAYAQKIRAGSGRMIELWPLRPDRMEVRRAPDGALVYEYTLEDGKKQYFRQDDVMHVRGMSSDGVSGLSPIEVARREFEASNARTAYAAAFYENGARPGGVLKHPGRLSDAAYGRIRAAWENRHQGPANANRIAILEEGMDFSDVGIPQSDQQFIEQEKMSASRIAAIFRVPAHMVNDLERATFSNIEEMGQEFVDYTLTPWFTVWEQAISRDLLKPNERARYYAKHVAQALLRGNAASRSQFYANGLQWGYFSINDVRALEDLNPVADGDTYFVPMNMVPLEQAVTGARGEGRGADGADVPATDDGQRSAEHGPGCSCVEHRGKSEVSALLTRAEDAQEGLRVNRVEMARAQLPILEEIAGRLVRRETKDVRRQLEKSLKSRGVDDFRAWLDEFYGSFDATVVDFFRAAMLSYARQAMLAAASELGEKPKGLTTGLREFVGGYLEAMGAQWARSSRLQIEALLDEAATAGSDPAEAVTERLAGWEETRPAKHADSQAFEALNAFVIASYGSYDITEIRWLASGESCPYCQSLSGRTVGIEKWFVESGSAIEGGADLPPMLVRRNTRHGPIHRGCDCITVAVR